MSKHIFISDKWKQWVATNIALGHPPKSLVDVLVANGFSIELATLEVETASRHPYIESARSLVRQLLKRDWVLHSQREMEQTAPALVQRVDRLSQNSFLSDFYSQNRPVIITDLITRWPAIGKWNREYFIAKAGGQVIEIQSGRNKDRGYATNSTQSKQLISFAEYVRRVFDHGNTVDDYMTESNSQFNQLALSMLWDDVDSISEYLIAENSMGRKYFGLVPEGAVTPLHHNLANVLMSQVLGRKVVRLISPANWPLLYNDFHRYSAVDLNHIDLERFPLFKRAHIEEIELSPGELLFVPVGWWHHETSLDVSVTLTFTNFRWQNDFTPYYRSYGII